MSVQGRGWARDPLHAAGGRARYNGVRTLRAQIRRAEVARLLLRHGWRYGTGVRIAEALGVSEATVSRDIYRLFRETPLRSHCPICGAIATPDEDDDPMEPWGGPLPMESGS